MKKEKIKKLANTSIKKWKSRLGFSDWKIDAKVTVFKRADGFPQDGDFIVNYGKKRATILIGTILKSSVEEIIVHELVHLMLWPIDQKTMSTIRQLPQSKQKRAKSGFLDELEEVVEQITKSFLRDRQ
ncbi:MAG: hypothetical protein AAB897_04290 [Patescibacteria group bacterium]